QLIRQLSAALSPVYGKDDTPWLVRMIFEHLKGWSQTDILLHQSDEVSDFIVRASTEITEKVAAGQPIQYVLGETWWHGLRIKVTPAVLIPRPETSQLVDIIGDYYKGRENMNVLDLCTGSGCIAIGLAKTLSFAKITAVDISSAALEVARENAVMNKVKINFIEADVLIPLPFHAEEFDLIVANPPYVLESEKGEMATHVVDHEPNIALFVPDFDPIMFYNSIANQAIGFLKNGGRLFFEINPLCADSIKKMLLEKGFEEVSIEADMFGRKRFAIASKA
ncbi:MAG: peptide chain release factor N(5)-glutamine methyltransferase, partial [Duncaniella sp.]|nr:peptide chain release factor N(5)-glutamine methyltransferase [Duncaniella sp.]